MHGGHEVAGRLVEARGVRAKPDHAEEPLDEMTAAAPACPFSSTTVSVSLTRSQITVFQVKAGEKRLLLPAVERRARDAPGPCLRTRTE